VLARRGFSAGGFAVFALALPALARGLGFLAALGFSAAAFGVPLAAARLGFLPRLPPPALARAVNSSIA